MGQDSKGEDWEDNSRHAGDAVGSMASTGRFYGQQANRNCQLGRPLVRLGSPAK